MLCSAGGVTRQDEARCDGTHMQMKREAVEIEDKPRKQRKRDK